MLKKLTDEKIVEILEVGIAEFAEKGLDGANINVIAQKAGISVGVLYKYYKDKEDFSLPVSEGSLGVLESVLRDVMSGEDKILARAEKMIRAVQYHSRKHSNYINMYNEITAGSGKKFAPVLAAEIEGMTSRTYTGFIAKAAEDGDIRDDIDPRLFAFFFDNLLTMLQFSYCCGYYRERAKLYFGEDVLEDDEKVVSELLKFLESAFTFSRSEVSHSKQ